MVKLRISAHLTKSIDSLIVEANEKGLVFIGHNIKFDLTMLMNYDIVLENVYDTQQIHIILFKGFDKPSSVFLLCVNSILT
jgi:hypothetical protein